MNGRRLIDLSNPGSTRSAQASEKTPKCFTLSRTSSARYNRAVSAGSHISVSTFNHGPHTTPVLWPSRGTSAVTWGTSTVTRETSKRRNASFKRASNMSSTVSRLVCESTLNGSDFSLSSLRLGGLNVWALEEHLLHSLSVNDHGFFHQGNCYLILETDEDGCTFLHVWSGSLSHQILSLFGSGESAIIFVYTDQDIIQRYAREFDKSLGGSSFMSLEHEENETSSFLKHFEDGIIIVEGKFKQSLRRSVKYLKRLYRVHGRAFLCATCIECSVKAATVTDILILDGCPRTYIWVGQEVDFVLRVKAIKLAKKIRTWQRNGKGHIIVIDQENKQMSDAFLKKLDSDKESEFDTSGNIEENEINYEPHLYKINGERVLCDMPLVSTQPLQQKYLTTMDSFLLNMGPFSPLYIWVGNSVEPEKLYNALHCAENFKQHHCYSYTAPVCRMTEGNETMRFKKAFTDWKDRVLKGSQLVRSYHISNIEKVLFSKTDHHTVAKLSKNWSDDQFLAGNGTVEMWQVNGNTLAHLPQEQHKFLYKCHCYIILYKENIMGEDQIIIYFWQGSKTSIDCQCHAEKLALSMDSIMEHKTTIIRILDGKEPQHFLVALNRIIIVYDLDLREDDISANNNDSMHIIKCCKNTCMFCVQELASECVRVSQVPPVSAFLNSSAAYVIISNGTSVLWYGKNARACEREYSKKIPTYLCHERLHDYDIIIEGKETVIFWSLVQHAGDYPKQFSKPKLQRQTPTLAMCSRVMGKWSFIDIPEFSQEDLCDTDIFILDLHDQIQIWIGSSVVNRDHEVLSTAIQAYIDSDPAGRKENDLQIMFCNQDHESPLFRKYFKNWNSHGYGGKLAYEAARKRLRQENAIIDIDLLIANMAYLDTTKIPYKILVKKQDLPADIDVNHKEHYLSEEEFTRVFKMTRNQFYRLPQWKQHQIMRSSRIAPPSCNT